ncbi:MAG: hypothetical protein GON13_02935 [Nanoarchaeota archaeon]|nr:hypothetical protein [Nanoarchaeota archaeon]
MDLKLKDEITKILIEEPGLSISQIAKKTGNYYSYTHKLVSEMEDLELLNITKTKKGKRKITTCTVREDYKKKWVNDLKKFMKSLMKDAEIKAAFLMMYLFIAFQYTQKIILQPERALIMVEADTLLRNTVQETINNSIQLSAEIIILIITPLLFGIWIYRKRK